MQRLGNLTISKFIREQNLMLCVGLRGSKGSNKVGWAGLTCGILQPQ